MSTAPKQELQTEDYGIFVLKVADDEYVCSSILLNYTINAIPSARVTIGFGAGIREPSRKQRPDKLLTKVLAQRKQAYQNMLECEILERFDDGREKSVFSGVIVTGTPVYNANDKFSSKMVSLLCLNKICRLYVSPLSAFVISHGSQVINHMAAKGKILSAQNAQGDQAFELLVNVDTLVENVKQQNADGDVLSIVDGIFREYLAKSSYRANSTDTELGTAGIKLSDYLFSRIKVNPELDKLEKSYYQQIGRLMASVLNNSTVYDTLQQVLITDNFMLNLVPRFDNKNFLVELVPSYMWAPRTTIELDRSKIITVSSTFNPIACLNTPQVLMVLFDPLVNVGNQNTKQSAAYYGIHSSDADLVAKLSTARGQGDSLNTAVAKGGDFFRCSTLRAPEWLYPRYQQRDTNQSNGDDGSVSEKIPTITRSEDKNADNAKNNKPDPQEQMQQLALADKVAQALYAHKYGRQDTASLKVPSRLRFGYNGSPCFEDNLGNAVDVKMEADGELSDAFNFRGILKAVSFSYVTGTQSNVEYTLDLICVRPLDNDEEKIDCVLYKDLK